MTIEEFAHRCLMIKAGNATLDIPCCATCKHYVEHSNGGIIYKNGKVIKEVTLSSSWACHNLKISDSEDDDEFVLYMKPEDFCSRLESRNEEKEVKEENQET